MPQSDKELLTKLEKLLNRKIRPLFARYDQDIATLTAPLKWKPLVLVIGNYSSGKSTLINELLEREVQRVGQSPTDDSFTVLSRPEHAGDEKEVPGSAVVADERLPFGALMKFGERLFSHVRLKYVDAPILDHLAIIDTPGMLDSVTEKDRGYDYLHVVGELARLSDMIILMFDPHKAGTIKETFRAIRSILPGSTGEDRIFYVLNRIDDCHNVPDLVRSYGTLCWNLSQMTGRKDIPRIYLTYTEQTESVPEGFEIWRQERKELKEAVLTAPKLRINHIFEEVDRGIQELRMQAEAYETHRSRFLEQNNVLSWTALILGLFVFVCGDVILNLSTGFPKSAWLATLLLDKEAFKSSQMLLPFGAMALIFLAATLVSRKILLPAQVKKSLANLDTLVPLTSPYRQDLWQRVRPLIEKRLTDFPRQSTWQRHRRIQKKLSRFLERDLKRLFDKYQHENED